MYIGVLPMYCHWCFSNVIVLPIYSMELCQTPNRQPLKETESFPKPQQKQSTVKNYALAPFSQDLRILFSSFMPGLLLLGVRKFVTEAINISHSTFWVSHQVPPCPWQLAAVQVLDIQKISEQNRSQTSTWPPRGSMGYRHQRGFQGQHKSQKSFKKT